MGSLEVRVTPKSSREEIQYSEGVAKAWVRAAPADGQANEALCRLLAKRLGVARRRVMVVKGHSARRKLIEVEGLSDNELIQALS